MSLRSEVALAFSARVATVSTANGYPVQINRVFFDKIPLGLELTPEDMPAIFVLDDGAQFTHLHGVVEVALSLRLQVIDVEEASDARMNDLLRNIAKAIWANSPTAEVQDQFRIHPRVYQMEMDSDETDLHMIDGNRIATTRMIVHYRTRPYDL